jgi:hypothetical protein
VGDGILKGKRYRIHDRDPWFPTEFWQTLPDSGVASVKLPPRSPHRNAHAERFVRTIQKSCLERMILFGEGAVRKATAEFIAHLPYRAQPPRVWIIHGSALTLGMRSSKPKCISANVSVLAASWSSFGVILGSLAVVVVR